MYSKRTVNVAAPEKKYPLLCLMLLGKLELKEEVFLPLVEIQTSIWMFPQITGTTVSFCALVSAVADYNVLVLLQMAIFYSCFFLPMNKGNKPGGRSALLLTTHLLAYFPACFNPQRQNVSYIL